MRLISCHIENFGKLSGYVGDFSENITVFCEENGWGKSTFAAFLKAMFYGIEGKGKRTGIEKNEYKRYEPWQGGVYGGKVVFEANGKQYELTRHFDSDFFELRDVKTNLISTDYSENIGEELFKVNRDSFERTSFISQSDCQTTTTDDINAKIGNLSDNTNDLNNYEKADKALKDLLNAMHPTYKRGSIAQRSDVITELERKVLEGSHVSESVEIYQQRLAEEKTNFDVLRIQLDKATKEQAYISKLQSDITKKKQWLELVNAYQAQKETLSVLKNKFPAAVPNLEEVEEQQRAVVVMENAATKAATYELTQEEQQEWSTLTQTFEHELPQEQLIEMQLKKVQQLKSVREKIMMEQVAQNTAEMMNKNSKSLPITVMIGLLVAVIGAVIAGAISVIPGIIVAIIGAFLAIVGFFTNKKDDKTGTFSEDLRNRLDTLTKEADDLYAQISAFLKQYHLFLREESLAEELYELRRKVEKYSFLKKKKEEFENAVALLQQYEQGLAAFLNTYGLIPEEDLQGQFRKLRDQIQEYETQKRNSDVACAKMESYRQEIDDAILELEIPTEDVPDLDRINEQIEVLTKQRETSFQVIENYKLNLEGLQEQMDSLEETKIYLEELKELQASEKTKYGHIELAKKYLGKAKESLTAKYVGPIKESFAKYYEIITKQASEAFRMDANTNLTLEVLGKQREMNTLSSGYQDLIGICLRVALVDAMYTEELPILIMDDPFTNLDDGKIGAAKEFLKEVSEKYQIIYFTCSEARV